MNKGKKIYFGVLLLITFLISTMYFSYAYFTSLNEEHGKLNIVAGTLNYKVESNDLENNQITVSANSIKQITINVTSLNDISSKYELYYIMTSGLNVDIGYNSDTKDFPVGEIDSNETKAITVSIRNNTSSSQMIKFGVEGGLVNNDLVLTNGNSISEFKIYAEAILNGADPVLTNNLVPVQIAENGTVIKADINTKWYSYEEQSWANAVVLKDNYDNNKIYDLSGNSYNGTFMNGARVGKDENGNYALILDGVDDYVDIVDLPATVDWEGGFTIEFEAMWKSLNVYSRILDFSDIDKNDVILVTNSGNSNSLSIGGRSNGINNGVDLVFANQINLGEKEKFKFVVTKNSENYSVSLYKNDILIETQYHDLSYFRNVLRENCYLGKSAWEHDGYFNGNIYNLKIIEADGSVVLNYNFNTYARGDIISEDNIESYFVWIPKYSYQLWDLGNYSSLTSITSKEQQINIRFGLTNTNDSITGECTTPGVSGESGNCQVGDYMTHPAFLAFDVNGIWVGKFETGYDGATSTAEAQVNSSDSIKIIIKPNVYSWRRITVGNMFKASYDYLRSDESHIMKNTEWGAVAYLQHSVYGSQSSLRINNNSAYITGYAGTEEPTLGYNGETNLEGNRIELTPLTSDGTYTINYLNSSSVLASTTGNITGIYDMSGGTYEYVAGYTMEASTIGGSSGITSLYSDFFTNSAWNQYYDKYSSTTNTNYNKKILGDATGEMGSFGSQTDPDDGVRYKSSWYVDYAYFPDSSYPWFGRGGLWSHGSSSGAFAFRNGSGGTNIGFGFRIVLAPTK